MQSGFGVSMNKDITVLHHPADNVTIKKEPTIYATQGYVYIMLDPNQDFLKMARMLYEAEKDTAEWIRRYQNVLNGLEYWKDKALSK